MIENFTADKCQVVLQANAAAGLLLANIASLMSQLATAHLASLRHGLHMLLLTAVLQRRTSLSSVMLGLCDLDLDNALLAEPFALIKFRLGAHTLCIEIDCWLFSSHLGNCAFA